MSALAAVSSPASPLSPAPHFPTTADCDRVLDLLAGVRDLIDARPDGLSLPAWCVARGWDEFLLGLSDAELIACEEFGPGPVFQELARAPATLVDLAREVAVVTRVPRAGVPPAESPGQVPSRRFPELRPRKERQVAAMLELGRPLASRARRLVDVGCGRGLFTAIAAATWDRPALGLEREARHVLTARARNRGARTEFRCVDIDADLSCLAVGDLALGLHACGDLGDAMVRAAAGARASLLLVACCHQKIRGVRRLALSRQARARGLDFAREVLGLANLVSRAVGFEGSLAGALEARQRRHALAHLLRDRGIDLSLEDLRHALHRRESFSDWAAFATRALHGLELPPPSSAELTASLVTARQELGQIRRLSLPRHLLARLLELGLAIDRAAYLAEAGLEPLIQEVFDSDASPRNLALMAFGAVPDPV